MHWKELKAFVIGHAKSSGRSRLSCPVCEEHGKRDRKRSLGVDADAGYFRCFRCGTYGRIKERIESVEEEEAPPTPEPRWFVPLSRGDGLTAESTADAREYLAKRIPDEQTIFEADMGTSFTDRTAGRIVCPFKELDGNWWGYSARVIHASEDAPKYRYPEGMRFGMRMYNQRACGVATEVPLIVVEGVFDALSVWPHGVALLGKPSARHIEALISAWRPVVVVLDGDAQIDAWKLTQRLRIESVPCGMVTLPVGVDPDEVDRGWLFREATRALDAKL